MPNNIQTGDFAGTSVTVATTEAGGVHTPHHRDPELIALITTMLGNVDGVEALLTALNGYVDGLEGLATTLNGLITTQNGYVDGIEGLTTALNALITTQNGYVDGLEALAGAATPAGENRIGSVGGNTAYIDVTLSLDTNPYAAGEVLADTQAVAAAMRINGGTGVLQSITLIDQDDQKAQLKLLLLSGNVVLGTENAAPSISDTDALKILGAPITIETTDYTDLGGVSIAGKDNIGRVVKADAGSTSLFIAVFNGAGTPTYTSGGIKLRLGFLQD